MYTALCISDRHTPTGILLGTSDASTQLNSIFFSLTPGQVELALLSKFNLPPNEGHSHPCHFPVSNAIKTFFNALEPPQAATRLVEYRKQLAYEAAD